MNEHPELAELDRSELEQEYISRCVEIGQQVSEICRLQAQRDTMLAACKGMVVAWDKYEARPVKGTADAMQNLRAAITKAEGGHE